MVDNKSQHISQQFEADLQDIRSRVLAMGGLVEQQVARSLKALKKADLELAHQVIADDDEVNNLEMSIDEECIQIIALRQPTASDLRLVSVILKTLTDIERIGDEAKSIARKTLNLGDRSHPKKSYRELSTIGNHVRGMLRDALDAFARLDVDAAIAVARQDQEVDEEYESFTRTMITYMMEDPRTISRVLDLMWAARALERIGDHARNLCEYVIYLVEGKDVRHLSIEHMEKILQRD